NQSIEAARSSLTGRRSGCSQKIISTRNQDMTKHNAIRKQAEMEVAKYQVEPDREPGRVQLRRLRGWKLPGNTVVVARPTPWGNPFKRDRHGKLGAVNEFRKWIGLPAQAKLVDRANRALAGRNLACWCKPGEPCHADVWLELANPKLTRRTAHE